MLKKIFAVMAMSLVLSVGVDRCSAQPAPPTPDRATFAGRHGINVAAWLTWISQTSPSTYRQPLVANPQGRLSDGDIEGLHQAGFDFVRLTVDPGLFVLLGGDAREAALQSVTGVVDQLLARNLAVIVDMHPVRAVFPFGAGEGGGVHAFEKGPQSPLSQRYALATAWLAGQLDTRYAGSRQIAFELMNEPDLACGDPQWAGQILSLHAAVRKAAPGITLILNGACSDGIDGLVTLDPTAFHDENTLFTFHFYEDERFTSAGLVAGNSDHDLGLNAMGDLPYPGNARPRDQALADVEQHATPKGLPALQFAIRQTTRYLDEQWDSQKIEGRMDKVAQWAAQYRLAPSRILMGEFGVNGRKGKVRGERQDDRLRWINDVRQAAEHHTFRWALWQYRGNGVNDAFDLEMDAAGNLDPGVLRALGLTGAAPGQSDVHDRRTRRDN